MTNKKLLLISNDTRFFLYCQVTIRDDFDFIYTQHKDIGVYYNDIPNVSGVLVCDKDVSTKQMNNTFSFLQRAPKDSVFICTERDDPLKHDAILINSDFRKNVLLRMKNILPVEESAKVCVKNKNTVEEQNIDPVKKFRHLLDVASRCESPVLLLGETGSGKNYAAKYIHCNSSRKNKLFTNESLANINPNLMESALFGSTKGAFTGAEEKPGILEIAKDGTLVLDEVGELILECQGKLLQFLDDLTFKRIGSSKEIKCKARLIFATDANLAEMVKAGLFKKQLFHRINVLVIEVPPLRERKEEIEPLATQFATAFGKKLSPTAIEKLQSYSWPGNIRDLKNCIERSCISTEKEVLCDSDIIF